MIICTHVEAAHEVVVGMGEGVSVAEVVRVGLGAGLRIQERPANLVGVEDGVEVEVVDSLG